MFEIMDVMTKLMDINKEVFLFLCIFVFMWLTYFWQAYLNCRQQKVLNKLIEPPIETSLIMNEENYKKARLYAIDTKIFSSYHSLYQMIESSAILCFNILPWLWKFIVFMAVGQTENLTIFQELKVSMLFLVVFGLYSFIFEMPWKVYSTFVIEQRHGFNKQTPYFFLKDQIKSLLVSTIIMLPISYCLLFIIKLGGPYFYVYAWIFAFVILMFLMFIYPEFIAPLFDKYTPLVDGELKTGIVNLAERIGFPLKKLYVVESSKRSSHSNAYFYGFWKNKRIVLFDTLLQNYENKDETADNQASEVKKGCMDEEVIAVLGHELGHWKLNHMLQNLIISQVNLFLMLFMFGILFNLNILFRAFGFVDVETPTLIRLVLIIGYLFSPYHFVLEFFMTLLSRKKEFEADEFAVNLGYGEKLVSALVKLHNDNLSFPIFDKLYSIFNHSHPPILERIEAIRNYKENKKSI